MQVKTIAFYHYTFPAPVARTIRSLHHSTRARIGFVCKWLQKCKGFLILAG